jgi:crossover junction endodeoxyribonuclease RuvC
MHVMGTYLGIDPSLTATAYCVLDDDGTAYDSGVIKRSGLSNLPVSERIEAMEEIANEIYHLLPRTLEVICVEGYSMGSNMGGHSRLVELGALIRSRLLGPRMYEVPPTTLKKFATGSGRGDKAAVASSLTKRYGVEFGGSDAADAYALARMAWHLGTGLQAPTKAMAEALAVVADGPKRKGKSKRA